MVEELTLEYWLQDKKELHSRADDLRKQLHLISLHLVEAKNSISKLLMKQYCLERNNTIAITPTMKQHIDWGGYEIGKLMIIDGMEMSSGQPLVILIDWRDEYTPFDDPILSSAEHHLLSQRIRVPLYAVAEMA